MAESSSLGRRLFRLMNKGMVLLWRLRRSNRDMATPYGGYVMVLVNTGRRSGLRRYTPLNYAEVAGEIWCLAGFGAVSDWYRNLLAHPEVELWLPDGRRLAALAADASDLPDSQRIPMLRAVLVNSGFAAHLAGLHVRRLSDAELGAATAGYRLVRLQPIGVSDSPGPAPGDLARVGRTSAVVLGGVVAVLAVTRLNAGG